MIERMRCVALIAILALGGCGSERVLVAPATREMPAVTESPVNLPTLEFPPATSVASVGNEIAFRAIALIGAPYRFGGDGPAAFDCSGLVQFVHQEVGIDVPRTVAEQLSAADRVPLDELRPGDLLFFRLGKARVSHVAIYTGQNRFVHAPQTGRAVEIRSFDDGYYRPRLIRAGRFREAQ